MALIGQEVSAEREIEIPDPSATRTACTGRARCTGPPLEQALDTPAHIYYKYEGVSPAGSHKPNTALAQAFYNKEEGVTRLATETGAGQWGSALAFAGAVFGLDVKVYMVRASYDQKPYRRILMETYGARVVASPSPTTNYGRRSSPRRPDTRARSGSRSARRSRTPATATTRSTRWARCSTTCCSTRPSSARRPSSRWRWPASRPTSIIGCTGGGSNFAGLTFPFLGRNFRGGAAPDHRRRARGGARR
jgi:tryptophan synthase beta chain